MTPLKLDVPSGLPRLRQRQPTMLTSEPSSKSASSGTVFLISTKYTKEDKKDLAILLIEKKTNLSARKIEKKLGFEGVCNGTKIGHHKKSMNALKKAMDASMWASLVEGVCKKWLPILDAANVADVSTLTMPSKSDLALSAGKRKRAAAIAGLNDMVLHPNLSYDDAAQAAAKRFKVDVLTGRTLRNLKEESIGGYQRTSRSIVSTRNWCTVGRYIVGRC